MARYFPPSPRPVRQYHLPKIPVSMRLVMDHSHVPSKLINLITAGLSIPRYQTSEKMIFELRYDDVKILESFEWLLKSRYCQVCEKDIEYQFKLLRPEEKQQLTLRTEVTQSNPKGRKVL